MTLLAARPRFASISIWFVGALLVVALAFLPLADMALGAVALVAIALAFVNPVYGVFWVVLSVPIQEVIQLPGGLSVTQATAALAVVAWSWHLLRTGERRIVMGRVAICWALLLWAFLLSSAFTPFSRNEALKETLRWAEAAIVWLIAVNTVRQRWRVWGLVGCLLLAPVASALLGIGQFVVGAGPQSFRIAANLPFVRAYGTFGTPNSFAGYLNMGWPLALAVAVGATQTVWRRWWRQPRAARPSWGAWLLAAGLWGATAALLLALLLTFSRGGWLGAVVGVFGMALAWGRRASRAALAAAALVVVALALGGAGALPTPLASRLTSITAYLTPFDPSTVEVTPANFAVVERMAQMKAAWDMFRESPLLGVGPGNYNQAYSQVANGPWYVSRGHAHNYYLHMLAQAGIVGLLAYLALLGAVAARAASFIRSAHSSLWRSIGVGCCGIIAAVAGHNLFENLHVLSMGIQLAAVWALACLPEQLGEQPAPEIDRKQPLNGLS